MRFERASSLNVSFSRDSLHSAAHSAFDGETNTFLELLKQAHVAVAETDLSGRFIRVSSRWSEQLGYTKEELLGLSANDITHPDSKQATEEIISSLRGGARFSVIEKKYLRKDGSTFWANVTANSVRDDTGKISGFLVLSVDATSETRGRRLLASQDEALRLIIAKAPLAEILDCLINVIETESEGEAVGSILLLDLTTQRLRHGSAPSLPDAYNRAIDGIGIGADVGTCAAAAARNETVITPDIASDPNWTVFKSLPLGLGLQAAWSMPIRSADGSVLGTFGTYFRRCRAPTPQETETVAILAKTASLAIDRSNSEEILRCTTAETERKRRLYETIHSNTPDLLYVFDLAHRFTYANKALLAMWGRTWNDAIGKNCLELGYEPWHAAMHDREIEQVIATKEMIRGEVAFNGTNGRRFYDYIFAPVIGATGEVEAIAGTTRDVTDKRKAADLAKFLADLSRELSVLIDEKQIIRHTIERVGRQVVAHRCHFVECLEKENLIKISEDWSRDASPSAAGSYNLYDFGGSEWWKEYSKGDFSVDDTQTNPFTRAKAASYAAAGVRSYAVQPVRRTVQWTVTLTVTDTQPRTWSEAELRLLDEVAARVWPLVERARSEAILRIARDEALAASRAKDDFLATLSHELRTPLNPVLLIASEAASDTDLPAEVRANFEAIVNNIALEARLIDDLLDLTRIAHDKLTLELKVQDLRILVNKVVATLEHDLQEKKLCLNTQWETPLTLVLGDEMRLQQIFWNLLKNAVKFTPSGGCISIVTRLAEGRPDKLAVEIADTGIGMTTAELKKVFNPFAQGEHSERGRGNHYGGLGLGLAISRKVAELHFGTISARSAGTNQGTTFVVELPFAPTGSTLSLPTPSRDRPPPTKEPRARLRVLLIEDHELSRQTLARLLAIRNMDVTQAGNAAEALAKARTNDFHLVISDIGLPDMNGYDLMKILRERHGLRGIALSGYGMEADIARSREAGFADHLTKPIQVQILDQILEQFR